jgi:hypothetical protein
MMNLSATIKMKVPVIGALLLLLFSFGSKGANITWNNLNGDNNWNTAGNWSTNTVPGPADVAIFNGTSTANCNLNADVNVRGVSITAAYTGTITQLSNYTINIGISNYAQAGGNFVGGTGTISFDSTATFTLSNGTFTSTSGDLIITGNRTINQTILNYTAGTFNHNNGTFIINPILNGCTVRTFTLNVVGTTNFYDVIIDGQSVCSVNPIITTSAGDIINATNNLTHRDGSISGRFAVKNNLTIDSTADEGIGSITVDGLGTQTYTVPSGTQRTCALIVNKTSGVFESASGTIDLPVTLFTLQNGDFYAPSGNLDIGGNWTSNQTLFNHSAGNFFHNNGILLIHPNQNSCVQRTFTINVIPSTEFYNVNVLATTVCTINPIITTPAGDTINASNNLTLSDGSISGKFAVKNDLIITNTADAGAGLITFNGTGVQSYTFQAGSERTCSILVNKASGSVEPAIGTIDLLVNIFTLQSGDFIAPPGNLDFGGTYVANTILYIQTGGNYIHNNGTLLVNPVQVGCASRTFTFNVMPGTMFYDVIVIPSDTCPTSSIITTPAGDTLNVEHDLIHENGALNGFFSVRNNLFIKSNSDGGTGNIIFNGTGTQEYSVEPGAARTCNIIVNKPSGILNPAAGTVDFFPRLFTLLSGDFTAPPGNLDLGSTWTVNTTIFLQTGGNYIHNNGTLLVNPVQSGCTQRTFTLNVIPGTMFYDVKIMPSDTCLTSSIITSALADTIITEHALIHENGVINGLFSVRNNLFIKSNSDGGTGTIIFNGTGTQEYSVEAGAPRTCNIIVDKPSGILNPAVGTINFLPRLFTLSSGDFTAPPGNLDLGSTWAANTTIFTQTGGNYFHNNGTLLINPIQSACAQRTFTLDVLPSCVFYDIVVHPTNGCPLGSIITTPVGDTLIAEHDLTHFDGIISGKFSVKNNLYIKSASDGGIGNIIVNGAADQYYFVDSLAPRTCGVIIDKASGNFRPDSSTSDFYVQFLNLLSGDFTAPSGTLNIGGSWAANATLFNQTGGNFIHNNGTVSINPLQSTCTQRTFTTDVLPTTEFYNFNINATSVCVTLPIVTTPVGDTVHASHDLIHIDGIINGRFSVKNDLIIAATADGGTGNITVNGTGNQLYIVDPASPRTCGVIVDKPAGTFSPHSSSINFNVQYFSLLSGDFIAPSGVLNTGGPWAASITLFSNTGGVYYHNNGTVAINPQQSSCTQRTFTIDVIPTTELYNVQINATSVCAVSPIITTAAGDTVLAKNNLTYTDGIVNGRFAVKNDLYIAAGVDGGNGSITANGTGVQTYTVDPLAPRICGLVINKPSGSFYPAPPTSNFSVWYFTLQSGDFIAPVDTFNVGGTWAVNQVLFNHTGGGYNHNNGTLSINPVLSGCTIRTFTLDVLSSTVLNNVEIKGIANCSVNPIIATAAGDNLNISKDFSHIDGTVNGQFSVKNNLRVASGADLATGTIYFVGTANQLYTFEAGAQRTCNIIINKLSGTVNPTVGTSNFLVQSTTLQQGDFTAPVGNLDIGGSWGVNQTLFNQISGTFHHNNGTLVFNPVQSGCTQRTFTIDVVPATEFFNMVFNGIQSCGVNPIITCGGGDSLLVKNQLRYQDGICNAVVKQEGNTDVSPTFDGGNGALIFQGPNNQDFDLTGANAFFNGPITINKSANDVTLLSPCILDQPGTQSLTLVKGRLRTSAANLLTIGDNVSVNGASAQSFVDGPCRKRGNDVFSFPVGKNSLYAPIAISAPALATDEYTAEFFPIDPFPLYNVYLKDPTLHHLSRMEYWILDRDNGTSNTTVTLSWSALRSGGVNSPADLLVGGWNGSLWKDRGNGGTTGDSISGTIVTSGPVNQYGPFTLTSGSMLNPLPIELSSFKGICINGENKLSWTTASESNNDYFSIEKSRDGTEWEEIGMLSGAGTSTEIHHYEFTDFQKSDELRFYRLKQTDFDGIYKYSDELSIDPCSDFISQEVVLYPNPASSQIHLAYHGIQEIKLIEIYNSLGNNIYHTENMVGSIDLNNYQDGFYYIRIYLTSGVIVQRFMVKN